MGNERWYRKTRILLTLVIGLLVYRVCPAEEKKESIEGVWLVTEFVDGGRKAGKEDVHRFTVRITRDSFTLLGDGKALATSTCRLGPAKKPKTIDLTPTAGPQVGTASLGIYLLDGDTLKICMGDKEGKTRPREFASPSGTDSVLMVLRRKKR